MAKGTYGKKTKVFLKQTDSLRKKVLDRALTGLGRAVPSFLEMKLPLGPRGTRFRA